MNTPYRYSPHNKQLEFHSLVPKKKVTLFVAGRGTGKTLGGLMQSLYYALRYKTNGLIVAPTYDMLTDAVIPMLRDVLPPEAFKGYRAQKKMLHLPNGSVITMRSGDYPDRLRGGNRDWVWLDEARNYKDNSVYKVTLAQLRNGNFDKMWITTTPAGLHHWLYKDIVEPAHPDVGFVIASTRDNPYLDTTYYTFLKTQYTGVYAEQELEARFVSFEGLVYDTFSLSDNVADVTYDPELPLYWGIDDGYARGEGEGSAGYHPRVILICQQTQTGGINVLAEYVSTLELPEVSIQNILQTSPTPWCAYIDSSAVELKRRLQDLGIYTISATHPVSEGIKVVRRYILDGNGERRLKIHPSCKTLIREMQTYRYADGVSGVMAGEPRPLKQDDHALDALRYLLYKLK